MCYVMLMTNLLMTVTPVDRSTQSWRKRRCCCFVQRVPCVWLAVVRPSYTMLAGPRSKSRWKDGRHQAEGVVAFTPILHPGMHLHWMRSPERIDFKLTVGLLVYRCLHGLAPRYLPDCFRMVVDSNRRLLRSSSTSQLVIQRTRLSTVDDRAFPVAGSRFWNSLPRDVTSAPTLAVFPKCLKSHLFSLWFPPRQLLYSCINCSSHRAQWFSSLRR